VRRDVTRVFGAHLSRFEASFGLRCERSVGVTLMLQYAADASLVTGLPTVEQVLDKHASELRRDFVAVVFHDSADILHASRDISSSS
jgi:hypothetical protein